MDGETLPERVYSAAAATLELLTVHLGDRLGLYRALAGAGASTADELAAAAGIDARYAREWLEQQAVAGIVAVADGGDGQRRFTLPAAHRRALLDPDGLDHVAPITAIVSSIAAMLPALADAYRTGAGVPYEQYGIQEALGAAGRPAFLQLLPTVWLPAIPSLHGRLTSDPPARVAEVGCGSGWAAIAIARAYPSVTVEAVDLDATAVEDARRNAAAAGVADRVRFAVADAAAPGLTGPFDAVLAFEVVHDLADPVGALRAMRAMAAPEGRVVVADEAVAPGFGAPGDASERWNYAWSVLHCLPVGRVGSPSAATGAVMREHVFREYAAAAGFADVEVLDVPHPAWRFYRLVG